MPITILAITLYNCRDSAEKRIKTEKVVFTKEGELSVLKAANDSLIAKLDIEIADNDYETQTGLMYRTGMQDDQAMLFVFPDERMHSFYMKNTQFALDIIFIKGDSTIASIQKNAEPYNERGLSSLVPVQYVLEVNAGLTDQWKLEAGDKIDFKRL